MANYIKFKKDEIDVCNICLETRKLSWDHIPPKGGIEITEVEQWNILQHMIGPSNSRYIPSQNGVKYRTLCQQCNNTLLGAKYDPVLNSFTEEVGQFLKTSLILPEVIKFKTKPAMMAKSVLGHLLAAKGNLSHTLQDKIFREYLLTSEMSVPKGYKIFYWIYPFNNVKIIQDFLMAKVLGPQSGTHGMFSIIKYFPIAFLVTDLDHYEGLDELTKYCTNKIDEEIQIPIRLSSIRSEDWPEKSEDTILFGGDDLGVFAKPKIKIIKKLKNKG